jgi:hypothetical protein
MPNIERWECPEHGNTAQSEYVEGTRCACGREGTMVEYVDAATYRGAVDRERVMVFLRAALERAEVGDADEAGAILRDAITKLGGQ